MAKPSKTGPPSPGNSQADEGTALKRELIVVAKREVGLRATKEGVASAIGADVSALANFFASENVSIEPLFGMREERLQETVASLARETGSEVPDLSVYYHVEAPDERLDELANRLRQMPEVDAAYVKPPAEPAEFRLNNMAPQLDEPPHHTPDFTARQEYLNAAPVGIDARHAWTLPGGRGAGVNIIDIEWGWRFTHEDLTQNQGGVVSGTNSSVLRSENHGTAVIGEFSGDRNTFGITGISSDAHVSAVSLVTHGTAQAIRIAADRLRPGDIILLEVHRPGPRGSAGSGQFGFIAIEWWPDDFDAIRYAVSKGIIVVEAAGNGGQNLDDAIYNTRPVGHPELGTFPTSWRNPFNPANPTSGAVVVGAGLPPTGTHGRNRHPDWGDVYADRGRCFFSNYGARVDAQGWGWEVTSTGYGDLQGGTDRNQWYTDQFSGTSSASPIVVGALACVQGVLRAHGRIPLSPARAIELLRATGSPQEDGPAFTFIPNMTGTGYPQNHPARPRTQRIGNRPNLRQLIARALETRTWVGVQFTGTIPANGTQCWFTHSWPAHWHVVWTVVPTSPRPGGPQIEWKVKVERASDRHITYWICITNLTPVPVSIEARYAVLGW
ncbi:Serine protease [Candidatus Nitrospira inopinata]|uniref:Serine protease n=1 Tax=Candidatus Nitrospira inopinata TaxID=1715989 RepID=A0A0S4KRT8_9BACT|nr:Serine protease [Candidatus Nitrospira inopinata]